VEATTMSGLSARSEAGRREGEHLFGADGAVGPPEPVVQAAMAVPGTLPLGDPAKGGVGGYEIAFRKLRCASHPSRINPPPIRTSH